MLLFSRRGKQQLVSIHALSSLFELSSPYRSVTHDKELVMNNTHRIVNKNLSDESLLMQPDKS